MRTRIPYFSVALFTLCMFTSRAQVFNMPFQGSDSSSACTGTLYDNGGPSGFYQAYANDYFYITPPAGGTLTISFTQFNTYSSSDRIQIYDGIGTNGSLLLNTYGSSLPSGGGAITVPSGQATVYFYSNCCSQSTGFALSWSGSSTVAPNAQFSASNLNPPLNIPINFINTSTGGGNYLWDFGDGSSSTEISPSHSYSTPGSYNAKLISTNCQGSDTSSVQTINVLNGPEYKAVPDSIYQSVSCGGTWNASFTLSDTAGGVMYYSLKARNKGYNEVVFSENFENGFGQFTLSPNALTQFTPSIINGGAASGNSYVQLSGYTNSYEGLNASFPSRTPTKISYYLKPTNTSYQGYHAIGENLNQFNEQRMYYAYLRYSYIYVYQNGFYSTYYVNSDQWNYIELRNIDWTAKTYDLYINGSLAQQSAGFAQNTATAVSEMRLFNTSSNICSFDNIRILEEDNLPLTMTPTSGVLSVGNSQTVNISGNTSGMTAGLYEYEVKVSSNAAGADSVYLIPLIIDITGTSNLNLNQNCINHGSIFSSQTDTATLMMYNTGCDSLIIDSLVVTNADFVLNQTTMGIGAFDTAYLECVFIPGGNSGTYADTIHIYYNGQSDQVCLDAVSTLAPVVATDSVQYNLSSVGCNDSIPFSFKLYNQGGSNLAWVLNSSAGIVDDFENGFNNSIWQSHGSNNITSACLVNSGSYGLSMDGSGSRIAETVYLNVNSGDSVKFWAFPGTSGSNTGCENPDGNEDVHLEYSLNGSTWTYMGTAYNYNTLAQFYSFAIPVSGQVKFRLIQTSHSGSGYDNYIIDDFGIVGGGTIAGGFNPSSGNLPGGDSVQVSGMIDVSGLTTGSYTRTLTVSSNDPVTPKLQVTVNIQITGTPNLLLAQACLDFDSLVVGSSITDSTLLINDGCENLVVNSNSVTNPDFSVSIPVTVLQPEDSVWVFVTFNPASIGTYTDTVYINTNDTTGIICLNAKGLGAPTVDLDTSLISVTINSCDDSVLVQRTIYNNGQGGLNFKISGSDGDVSLQDVLDTFKVAHSGLVSNIPSPYYFYDGINGYSISDGGGDMYDGGNIISTNLSLGNVYYSNDLVIPQTAFGTNGQYFTYKGTGMWLLAADLDGVNDFHINGNLGADGSGNSDAAVLTTSINGVSYTGFVKRVYNAGDPSVNHLVMVRTQPGQSHTWATNTNDDNHSITGLSANTRIYYLLYAGSLGSYIDNNVTLNIMTQFLQLAEGSSLAEWLSVQPDSGQVAIGDSSTIDIWIKSGGLSSGVYNSQVNIDNNDPANPSISIPVQLTVNGQPDLVPVNYTPCLSFTNIQQGATASDSVLLYNAGCDTLRITSATGSGMEFGVLNLPLNIAPGDTLPMIVSFNPVNVGSFSDTLIINNNDTTFSVCANGTSVGAPLVNLPVDTLEVDLNKCNIIKYEKFKIGNNGLGAMNYDLEIGSYTAASQLSYNQPDATTLHTFNSVPSSDTLKLRIILHGDYDTYYERTYLVIDNSYFYGYLPDNGKHYVNDTIDLVFFGTNVQNWTSDGVVDISLDNSFDVDGGAGSFHRVEVEFAGQVNWVSIVGSTTGTVAPGAVANKNLLFNAVNLPLGTYQTNMRVTTNSPANPLIQVPLILNVISEPEIEIADTCVNFPLTLLGDTSTYDLWVYNRGCQNLNLSNLLLTNPAFKVTPTSGVIPIGDSLKLEMSFIPSANINYSASLIITNNDTTQIVCLNGLTGALPIADFAFSVEKPCLGEVHFIDMSQYVPTSYLWDFGDGNFSSQVGGTVIHTYTKPGTYDVRLRVSNSIGFDTIVKQVTVAPFYVDFDYSNDSVLVNQQVSFYDSSYAATSWTWTFGDGNTSSIQNPTHSYAQLGNYQVNLIAVDSAGCQNTVQKTIYVVKEIGIGESKHRIAVELYPNPARDEFKVRFSGISAQHAVLSIRDISGKLLLQRNIDDLKSEYYVNISSLPQGTYMVLLHSEEGIMHQEKLIID